MDPTVQVAVAGIATAFVMAGGAVLVAVVNNNKERGSSAESAMERTLRERITLRDEQILDLKADIEELEHTISLRDHRIEQLAEEVELLRGGRI